MKILNQPQIQKYNTFRYSTIPVFQAKAPVKKTVCAAAALASAGMAAVAMNKGKLSHLSEDQKTEIRQMRLWNRKLDLSMEKDIEQTLVSKATDLRKLETEFYKKLNYDTETLEGDGGKENSSEIYKNPSNGRVDKIIDIINDKNRKIPDKHIIPFLMTANENNLNLALDIFTDPEKNYKDYEELLYDCTINEKFLLWMIHDKNMTPKEIMKYCISFEMSPLKDCSPEELKQYYTEVQSQKTIVNKHPDLYLNEDDSLDVIEKFFNIPERVTQMMLVLHTFKDKSFLNDLLRLRLYDACEYMDLLENAHRNYVFVEGELYTNKEPEVGTKVKLLDAEGALDKLLNAKNPDGSSLSFKQKLFILKNFNILLILYKDENINNLFKDGTINKKRLKKKIIDTIVQESVHLKNDSYRTNAKKVFSTLDTEKLMILLYTIFKNYQIYKDQEALNIKTPSIRLYSEVLYSICYNYFEYSLFDKNWLAGKTNIETLKIFKKNKLNFVQWLSPRKTEFKYTDENIVAIKQISAQLLEDIDNIRKSPAGGIFDKKMKEYIQDGRFVIPQEVLNNPNLLKDFIRKMLNVTQPIKHQAEKNNNKNALTLFYHIEQRGKDLNSVKHIKGKKDFDLTIKMWDRKPLHDLFQGNYSDCCIALDECHSSAMFEYISNLAFNMIEIVDNQTGDTIGNALCYFAKNKGKPVFIIDNIEIKPSMKPSENGQKALRNAIADFAKQTAVNVSGNKDIEVYLGTEANDVVTNDIKPVTKSIKVLGEAISEEVYLDVFGGWKEKEKLQGNRKLIQLR